MKNMALLSTALAIALPCLALAAGEAGEDAAARAARLQAEESAWDRIQDAGTDLRDGVADAVDSFVGGVRSVVHARPELQNLPHLVVLRKGASVKVAYCRPLLAQLFRDRTRHPSHNRCDEALTNGSFELGEIKLCAARHAQEGGAAFNLHRQLQQVMESDGPSNYYYEAMFGTRDEYRSLFRQCQRERKPVAKPQPAADPAAPAAQEEQPKLEFKPVDHSNDQPVPDAADATIGG